MVHLPVLRRHSAGAIGALLHDEWAAPLPGPASDPAGARRARIWDIAPNLHCSVIGKPFIPLRSASVASFLAAIAAPADDARLAVDPLGLPMTGGR